jgi:hypothetical protein
MRSQKSRFIVSIILTLAGASAWAAAPAPVAAASRPQALNQQAIHVAYNEGDFDKVMKEIESFTKVNKTYSRADSIFISKHLAVVYTANPGTREKGKYYMYRLLEMMPSAELVDMFVSDEIDRIFEKVRKEFVARQSSFGVDTTQIALPGKPSKNDTAKTDASAAAPASASASAAKPGHSDEYQAASGSQPMWKNKALWIAGGAGVVVAGAIITYVSFSDESSGGGKTIHIPGSSQP